MAEDSVSNLVTCQNSIVDVQVIAQQLENYLSYCQTYSYIVVVVNSGGDGERQSLKEIDGSIIWLMVVRPGPFFH